MQQPDWLDHLEKRIPGLAVPGVIRVVSIGMLFAFGLITSGTTPQDFWLLSGDTLLHGQIWRVFTFLFHPPTFNMILLIFELMILVMCGDGLEEAWGSFRVTVYYLTGAIATILCGFLVPEMAIPNTYLNLSLFLAFATIYPDYEILLFFIIPVKIKYLALFSGLMILYTIVTAPLLFKIVAALSIGNYLLFFGPAAIRLALQTGAANLRRRQFEQTRKAAEPPRHFCCVCGRNPQSDPNICIRYCTCKVCGEDGRGFCEEHLKEHEEGTPTIH